MSLQADVEVVFEDIPMFGVCRPACHDSSLYLFVLVIFLEAVVLSQSIRCLQHFLSAHCSRLLGCCLQPSPLILRCSSRLLSCSMGCSCCGVSVHKNISSAKRRVVFSQFNRLNILSSAAVNNLGEKLSPCLTPLLILIFSLSLCRCTVTELSVFQDFYVRIFYSLFLQ